MYIKKSIKILIPIIMISMCGCANANYNSYVRSRARYYEWAYGECTDEIQKQKAFFQSIITSPTTDGTKEDK